MSNKKLEECRRNQENQKKESLGPFSIKKYPKVFEMRELDVIFPNKQFPDIKTSI